jgi:hypothetical protein
MEDQSLQDLTYVRNYSLWEDLRILLQSARPGAILGRWQVRNASNPLKRKHDYAGGARTWIGDFASEIRK